MNNRHQKGNDMTAVNLMWTRDYDLFKIGDWDRPISQNHVEKLKESIQRMNLLAARPMLCAKNQDGDLVSIDGKHRLEACRQMKIQIPYLVIDANFDIAILLNSTSKKWTSADYCNFHAAMGKPSYIWLKRVSEKKGVKISLAIAVARTTTDDFNSGEWTLDKAQQADFDEFFDHINDLQKVTPDAQRYKFAYALHTHFWCDDEHEYDPGRMIKNLPIADFVFVARISDLALEMARVYKYRHRNNELPNKIIQNVLT